MKKFTLTLLAAFFALGTFAACGRFEASSETEKPDSYGQESILPGAAVAKTLAAAGSGSGGFSVPAEMTLTIGETNIIEPEGVPDGAGVEAIWTSSNPDVATVTDGGIIYGKAIGETTITVMATIGGQRHTGTTTLRVIPMSRDSILVLDISGSMSGVPMEEMKRSAIAFCEAVLSDGSNNRVGLVLYDAEVYTYDLTSDIGSLLATISYLQDGSTTNLQGGLQRAMEMMDAYGRPGSVKNIIVMADGMPNEGFYSTYGHFSQKYSSSDYSSYSQYADSAYETATQIMSKYNLYSLGYLHSLTGDGFDYATDIMQSIQNKGYYQVNRAEDLAFVFAEITTDVSTGARLVINIACPVDVEITYGGERLSSAQASYNDYTSFGTLQLLGKNRDIKVLTLSPDIDYHVELTATGKGEMNYTANYFDNGENIIDSRTFPKVPLTPTTYITANTERAEVTKLNIDVDGDGKVDMIWEALENSIGKRIGGFPIWGWVLLIVVAIGTVTAIVVVAIVMSRGGAGSGSRRAGMSQGCVLVLKGVLAGAEIFLFSGEPLRVGRDTMWANLVIDEKSISRRHCTITYDGAADCYYVYDESSHGTQFEDGRKLAQGVETRVEKGTQLTLASGKSCVLLLK